MRKVLIGLTVGLASMATVAPTAGAQGHDQPVPPPMDVVVEVVGCINRAERTKPAVNGQCTGRGFTMINSTTVYNPAGHAPGGLNK